jgi:hypothetical protein
LVSAITEDTNSFISLSSHAYAAERTAKYPIPSVTTMAHHSIFFEAIEKAGEIVRAPAYYSGAGIAIGLDGGSGFAIGLDGDSGFARTQDGAPRSADTLHSYTGTAPTENPYAAAVSVHEPPVYIAHGLWHYFWSQLLELIDESIDT